MEEAAQLLYLFVKESGLTAEALSLHQKVQSALIGQKKGSAAQKLLMQIAALDKYPQEDFATLAIDSIHFQYQEEISLTNNLKSINLDFLIYFLKQEYTTTLSKNNWQRLLFILEDLLRSPMNHPELKAALDIFLPMFFVQTPEEIERAPVYNLLMHTLVQGFAWLGESHSEKSWQLFWQFIHAKGKSILKYPSISQVAIRYKIAPMQSNVEMQNTLLGFAEEYIMGGDGKSACICLQLFLKKQRIVDKERTLICVYSIQEIFITYFSINTPLNSLVSVYNLTLFFLISYKFAPSLILILLLRRKNLAVRYIF